MKLWEHQLDAIERFKNTNRLAVFFETGTGKTLTACKLINLKKRRGLKVILVCPGSLENQWEIELDKHECKTFSVVGSGKKKREKIIRNFVNHDCSGPPEFNIFNIKDRPIKALITNPEFYASKANIEILMHAQKSYDFLLIDESHKFKTHNSARTKNLTKLVQERGFEYRVLLSGTPVLNGPLDIWAQYNLLSPGIFSENFFYFRNRFFLKEEKMSGSRIYAIFSFNESLQGKYERIIDEHCVRCSKEECLDLPDLVKQVIPIKMSKTQERVYRETNGPFVTTLLDKTMSVNNVLSKMIRLQEVICGIFTEDITGKKTLFNNNRIDALLDMIQSIPENDQILVWCNFTLLLEEAAKQIKSKLKTTVEKIYGQQTKTERNQVVSNFKSKKTRVLVCNQKAGGTGLDFPNAKYSIFLSRGYSLEEDIQSEARNYRGGSEIHNKVLRTDIYTPGTIDEEILDSLKNKKSFVKSLKQRRK